LATLAIITPRQSRLMLLKNVNRYSNVAYRAGTIMPISWLDEMTWADAEAAFSKTDVAVICCGATHPHGVVCPLGTDTFVAQGMGERIGRRTDAIVLPTIPFGYNTYHMDFPGCIDIPKQHLAELYMDVGKSLHKWGIRKLVFLSPHGGNHSIIEDVAIRLRYEQNMLSALVTYDLAGQIKKNLADYHSEGMVDEASMMLYLRPDTVHPERVKYKGFKNSYGSRILTSNNRKFIFGKGAITIFNITKDISDNAEWGNTPKATDMSNATRELGEDIIETAVNYIVEFIEEFKKVKIPEH
jgi:creatinine amidohydrolase